MQKYNLLLVEDHVLIRFGLKTALEVKDYVGEIYEASNAEEAVEITKTNHVDGIVMDIGLPNTNGIEATEQIKNTNPDVKVIVLTSHNTESEVIDSIKAGATAYCSKDINPDRLADVILSVLEGALWFDPKISDMVINAIIHDKEMIRHDENSEYNLTMREKQVLKLIREGLNNNEIAKKLFVSINTTKVHVSSIIQKLGVEDRTQAAIKALNNNII